MLEDIWALFFFKPEKATNNTAALVASEAVAVQISSPKFGIVITAACQNDPGNKLISSFIHYWRGGGMAMAHGLSATMWMGICLCAYRAELETLGLCSGRACNVREAEHFVLTLFRTHTNKYCWMILFCFSFSSNRSLSFFLIWVTHFASWSLIIQRKGQNVIRYYFCTEH